MLKGEYSARLCCEPFGTVKGMESQITIEMVETLIAKGFIPAEIALDGETTTFSALLRTFVYEVIVRYFGGEIVSDMKADDRHLLTTIKNHLFKTNKQLIIVRKGKPNVAPMSEPHDCYYLSTIVNMINNNKLETLYGNISTTSTGHIFPVKMPGIFLVKLSSSDTTLV